MLRWLLLFGGLPARGFLLVRVFSSTTLTPGGLEGEQQEDVGVPAEATKGEEWL